MSAKYAAGVAIALCTTFLNALGLSLQKRAHMETQAFNVQRQRQGDKSPARKAIRNWKWLLGLACMGSASLLSLAVFALVGQSVASAFAAITIVYNMILARLFLKERVGRPDVAIAALMITGTVLVVAFGSQGGHTSSFLTLDDILSIWRRPAAIAGFICFGALAGAFAAIIYRTEQDFTAGRLADTAPRFRATLFMRTATSGLCSGFVGTFSKAVVSVFSASVGDGPRRNIERWETWILVLCLPTALVIQVLFLNSALRRFAAAEAVPLYQSMVVMCGLIFGWLIFNEASGKSGGAIGGTVVGFLLIVTGILSLLARKRKPAAPLAAADTMPVAPGIDLCTRLAHRRRAHSCPGGMRVLADTAASHDERLRFLERPMPRYGARGTVWQRMCVLDHDALAPVTTHDLLVGPARPDISNRGASETTLEERPKLSVTAALDALLPATRTCMTERAASSRVKNAFAVCLEAALVQPELPVILEDEPPVAQLDIAPFPLMLELPVEEPARHQRRRSIDRKMPLVYHSLRRLLSPQSLRTMTETLRFRSLSPRGRLESGTSTDPRSAASGGSSAPSVAGAGAGAGVATAASPPLQPILRQLSSGPPRRGSRAASMTITLPDGRTAPHGEAAPADASGAGHHPSRRPSLMASELLRHAHSADTALARLPAPARPRLSSAALPGDHRRDATAPVLVQAASSPCLLGKTSPAASAITARAALPATSAAPALESRATHARGAFVPVVSATAVAPASRSPPPPLPARPISPSAPPIERQRSAAATNDAVLEEGLPPLIVVPLPVLQHVPFDADVLSALLRRPHRGKWRTIRTGRPALQRRAAHVAVPVAHATATTGLRLATSPAGWADAAPRATLPARATPPLAVTMPASAHGGGRDNGAGVGALPPLANVSATPPALSPSRPVLPADAAMVPPSRPLPQPAILRSDTLTAVPAVMRIRREAAVTTTTAAGSDVKVDAGATAAGEHTAVAVPAGAGTAAPLPPPDGAAAPAPAAAPPRRSRWSWKWWTARADVAVGGAAPASTRKATAAPAAGALAAPGSAKREGAAAGGGGGNGESKGAYMPVVPSAALQVGPARPGAITVAGVVLVTPDAEAHVRLPDGTVAVRTSFRSPRPPLQRPAAPSSTALPSGASLATGPA